MVTSYTNNKILESLHLIFKNTIQENTQVPSPFLSPGGKHQWSLLLHQDSSLSCGFQSYGQQTSSVSPSYWRAFGVDPEGNSLSLERHCRTDGENKTVLETSGYQISTFEGKETIVSLYVFSLLLLNPWNHPCLISVTPLFFPLWQSISALHPKQNHFQTTSQYSMCLSF